MTDRLPPIFLPMDLVRLPDGSEELVNSSHYIDFKCAPPRRMFSVSVPGNRTLYYQDECQLLHRHDYKPYKGIKRCDCGAIYTTMADMMIPHAPVTWQ